MFFERRRTIIGEGLKIKGSVLAEGLVEVHGHIEGDLHCTTLVISPEASIEGGVEADRIVVDGRVDGPLRGGEIILKSHAHVVGDIEHRRLSIEPGAFFSGRSVNLTAETNLQKTPEKPTVRMREMELKAREPAAASAS